MDSFDEDVVKIFVDSSSEDEEVLWEFVESLGVYEDGKLTKDDIFGCPYTEEELMWLEVYESLQG